MHYLVRLIVNADTREDAHAEAERAMDELVEWHEFDWYTPESSESRWDECWTPVRLTSKKGKAWVKDAMQGQLDEFRQTMRNVRFMLEQYNDEQIFDEEFEQIEGYYLSRYQFSRASGYHANTCQLFGEDGYSITNQKQLDGYLKDTKNLWVVQVDCHN
jgi:hypothetical protein